LHRDRKKLHGCPTIIDKKLGAQGPYCALAITRRKPTSYWVTTIDRKTIYVHRLIMEYHLGRPLHTSEVVHHKDGNGLNNALDNLEILFVERHNRRSARRRWDEKKPF
jgi:hypothetical protein